MWLLRCRCLAMDGCAIWPLTYAKQASHNVQQLVRWIAVPCGLVCRIVKLQVDLADNGAQLVNQFQCFASGVIFRAPLAHEQLHGSPFPLIVFPATVVCGWSSQ